MTQRRTRFSAPLPVRPRAHASGDRGVRKVCAVFSDPLFLPREELKNDYGVDLELEALTGAGRHPTNFRCHAQIKTSNTERNRDGSFSYSVSKANLNYLRNSPNSFYVLYAERQDRLLYRLVESIPTTERTTNSVRVRFFDELDRTAVLNLHRRIIQTSMSIRDMLLSPNRRRELNPSEFVYSTDEDGKVVLLHNFVWEGQHGPIPSGHEVYHLNGDVYDNRRRNLDLRPTAHPFPLEEFQVEVSNTQFLNLLALLLEGSRAQIMKDVPPPPSNMFQALLGNLATQGWSISSRRLSTLRARANRMLGMRL